MIFPQRPSYFLELWITYPHWDSTLKLDITHQLTLRRTVLQSDGHHFFLLPMQPLWHTDACGKKKEKGQVLSIFTKCAWGKMVRAVFVHRAARGELQWEQKRKGKGEEGCSNDNLTTRLCGTWTVNSFHHWRVRWGLREKWKRRSSGRYFLCGWICASHATKEEAALI